ncbi:PaaI family thioesterase [Legionella maceachernii]|uniref:Thioesterase n=1 Tax=Legionella maceachernii TaxID=466 RepID=A0A0W0W103_9GAMM|nr:PaaI family thioesterase [Legionella maceachernii]KTD25590.1 hypothetical protein Lmac_1954 [Legionella maceachernii]SJZ56968.1 hypothetical protein SAMN02745128_00441 [Legionella maceachernii]SUP00558.1 Uncharacterised protein [Legionella maceachernii]
MSSEMVHTNQALQDIVATDGVCFGCGATNKQGLQIKSHWDIDGEHVIMKYTPDERYVGWPSLVYGGLISCLIDCHSNWTAMANHYRAENREPGTLPRIDCVTGSLGIKYIKPTPMGVPLFLKARVEGEIGRKTRILCEVYANDVLTVLGDSIFVKVDIGHLAKSAYSI